MFRNNTVIDRLCVHDLSFNVVLRFQGTFHLPSPVSLPPPPSNVTPSKNGGTRSLSSTFVTTAYIEHVQVFNNFRSRLHYLPGRVMEGATGTRKLRYQYLDV